MNRRRPAGFTLIELMISVAIIGVLASVAVPTFRSMQLRSKQSERKLVMRMIDMAMDDLWVREGRYPQGSAASSSITCQWNPAFPPGTTKKAWNRSPSYGDWAKLALAIDGNLYFSYYITGTAQTGFRYYYNYGYGDLDGDSRWNYVYRLNEDYMSGTTPLHYAYEYDSGVYDVTSF